MNTSILATRIPDSARASHAARLFGHLHPTHLEPAVFGFAAMLSADYSGGLWPFVSLSNGGFLMVAPGGRHVVASPNNHRCVMSAEGFGVTVCLYAYSHLSFEHPVFGDHFHLLRDYALNHPEAEHIFAACD